MSTEETAPAITQEVASTSTGLAIPTLRTLHRRFGIPERPTYTPRDLEDLHWIAERLEAGLSLGDAVTLWRASHDRSKDAKQSTRPGAAAALVDALIRYDTRSATSMLDDILDASRLDDVLVDVLQPALLELGRRWACGEATVEQEHFVTNFFRGRLLAWIHAFSSPIGVKGRAIAACAPDEQHEVGLLMLSLLLQVRGWVVLYLGQRVPGDRLGEAIETIRPDAVLFSATRTDHARALALVARSISESRARFFFGGQAFSSEPGLVTEMPGTVILGDARQAVARIHDTVIGSSPLA